jgi:hypothetical protein
MNSLAGSYLKGTGSGGGVGGFGGNFTTGAFLGDAFPFGETPGLAPGETLGFAPSFDPGFIGAPFFALPLGAVYGGSGIGSTSSTFSMTTGNGSGFLTGTGGESSSVFCLVGETYSKGGCFLNNSTIFSFSI